MFEDYLDERKLENIIFEYIYGIEYNVLKRIILNRVKDITEDNLEELTKYFYENFRDGVYDIYNNVFVIKILLKTISEIIDNKDENRRFYIHMRYLGYNPSLYEIVDNIIKDVARINGTKYRCIYYGLE